MRNLLSDRRFTPVWLALAGFMIGGSVMAVVFHQMVRAGMEVLSKSYFQQSMQAKSAARAASLPVDGSPAFVEAAEKTVNSVVYVTTRFPGSEKGGFGDVFQNVSSGSGVIISPDGYIVTNNHVVEDAPEIYIVLNDNSEYEAELVASDPNTDLAVLKIDALDLPAIKFADSDQVRIGEWVLAVGNPFNLTSTVTAGIVSAKARNIGILRNQLTMKYNVDYSIESFIQTDAAVNPGNSGGALVSLQGELIGINTAIATETGSYSGYSFAIPANLVKKVVTDLITYGVVQRGFIGVNIRDLDSKTAKAQDLKVMQGALVTGLSENGAAKTAGIQNGDIIVGVGEKPVRSASELQEQIANYRPGDFVTLRIVRGEQELQIKVQLRNISGQPQLLEGKSSDDGTENQTLKKLGANFVEPTFIELSKRKIEAGVKVTGIKEDGLLAAAGVPNDFIITKVGKVAVETVAEFYAEAKKAGNVLYLEGINTSGKKVYFAVELE